MIISSCLTNPLYISFRQLAFDQERTRSRSNDTGNPYVLGWNQKIKKKIKISRYLVRHYHILRLIIGYDELIWTKS